jgi:hypothetical protein
MNDAPRAPWHPIVGNGQVFTMFATDIAGYSSARRDEEIRLHLRDALYRMLREALPGAGIPWEACHHEDQGDGVLVLIPPGVPAEGVIDPLPVRLRHMLRRHNRISSEAARMQLRATMHVGPVYADAHGVTSAELTHLFRLLDAGPLRRALSSQDAELALAVSGYVHETLVLRHPSLADPARFTAFKSIVKGTTVRGWLLDRV